MQKPPVIMPEKKKGQQFTLVELLVVIAIFGLLGYWFWYTNIRGEREAAYRMWCSSNQKQIAMALQSYHDQYGQFPPACVTDKSGNPLYSWRVLILPFIEQEEFYKKFHLDEPWDSPHNKELSQTPISVFHCPSSKIEDPSCTNYVLITGPGTMFDGDKPCTIEDITSGTSYTVMLTEVAAPGVRWAEPKDLAIDAIDPQFLDEEENFKANHPAGVHFAFADGSVRSISTEANLFEVLEGLSQIKVGEGMTDEERKLWN